MPSLTRRFLATAALCLIAGMVIGLVLLLQRELGGRWPTPLAISAHTHLLLVGGVLEVIFGTALWFFPRPAPGAWPIPTWVGEFAWTCLTAGTIIRAAAELLYGNGGTPIRAAVIVGASLQVVGAIAGVIMLQPRVRASANVQRRT